RDKYGAEQTWRDFYEQWLRRIESLPGVAGAGAVNLLPMSDSRNSSKFQIVGRPSYPKGQEPYTEIRIVTPGYFPAIGTELRRGRLFNARDDARAPRVVLVNEAFAAQYLKDSEAVGRRLVVGDVQDGPCEIVGVVANVMNDERDDLKEPGVYLPFAQHPSPRMSLVVRAPGADRQIVPAARDELAALDPRLPLSDIKTMEQVVYERRSPREIMMW